ncbi:MAG: SGNH/GDSL hydrolase family protein [bacterium]
MTTFLAVVFLCGCSQTVLRSDFERSPAQSGWSYKLMRGDEHDEPWTDRQAVSGAMSLKARPGFLWESPPIDVRPLEYLRVRFKTISATNGYWAAIFYDQTGERLLSDDFDSVMASEEWLDTEVCVQVKVHARRMRLEFRPICGEMFIDDIKVTRCRQEDVAAWADSVYRTLPPVNYAPPPQSLRHLPLTMRKLREGKPLTIVMLGDSIVCDMGTGAWDVLLERAYPSCSVRTITSTRSGTGCALYMRPGMVRRYVLDYKPDLVIIGGISNHFEEATRSVVRQIRAGSSAEILLTTGVYWQPQSAAPMLQPTTSRAIAPAITLPRDLPELAQQERVAFLDLQAAVSEYLRTAGKSPNWYLRDGGHANTRGKQVLARILVEFFKPQAAR